jgi:putative ABC transport system substrate-binding protein
MRRRDFITFLGGGAATSLPVAARAQRDSRKRIAWVGITPTQRLPFIQELARLGWVDGRNLYIASLMVGDEQQVRAAAPGIVVAAPDLIVAHSTAYAQIFKQLTESIPILFVNVSDPVAAGLVESFARPGGNVTGFTNFQFSFAGKWLDILAKLVPDMTHVIVLYDPPNAGFLPVLQEAALTMRITVHPVLAITMDNVAREMETFGRDPNGGMVVCPSAFTNGNSQAILALATRHRLPTIYGDSQAVARGGLISYGIDFPDTYRRTAQYADRLLKGEKPADLPVQAPVKFNLAINVKTAKALGIEIPVELWTLADEVIE